MLGAIIGDIVGSIYECGSMKSKEFPLFGKKCRFTDDTVMTCAVADALVKRETATKDDFIDSMKEIGRHYPNCGYGGTFINWLFSEDREPYYSYGNGSAMRVSPCGWIAPCEGVMPGEVPGAVRDAAALSAEVTHNHPEGIKGAVATADAIYLARYYFGGYHAPGEQPINDNPAECKRLIKEQIERDYGYDLSHTADEIRPSYEFEISCQGTVPAAIIAFLDSKDYEDAIRIAISLGGDADTLAAITGGIAEAAYGIPEIMRLKALSYLDPELQLIVARSELLANSNGKANLPISKAERKIFSNAFAVNWIDKLDDPKTNQVDLFGIGSYMCIDLSFCDKYFDEDLFAEAFSKKYEEELKSNMPWEELLTRVDDIHLLCTKIFSEWRYYSHWDPVSTYNDNNWQEIKKWFTAAFTRLSQLTSAD